MEPTASRSPQAESAPDVEALAALLDCEADLDALERALLAAGVHPAGGGGEQAWLARWDERRGLLEGWRGRSERGEEPDLATCIVRARRAPPSEPADIERVRAWRSTPVGLQGACALPWRRGLPPHRPGAGQPRAPRRA